MVTKFKSKNKRKEFTDIYNQYYTMVFNAVYTKVSDADDTNDICQEIFIILYNKFEEIMEPRKWLFGTIRNVVKRYYGKKHPDRNIDDVFDDISLTFVNGFRDSRILIEEAIENIDLSNDEETILNLIAFHNYQYSKVAKVLGFTRRKVEYDYQLVVKRIISYLKSKGIKKLEDLL
ncbi:RNA polymerase sigma factor [Spirochaetota bacterium]